MANINGVNPPVLNDQDYVDKIKDSFDAIDAHDHTTGKGVPIGTTALADGGVTTAKLADGAVTTIKIADLNVTTGKLADSAVTTGKINDSAVTDAKIAGPITRSKLATGNAHRVIINDGSGAISEVAALTNGQVLIGSTGAAPVAATLTGTTNQVAVTGGAGSITLSTPQDIATTSDVTFNEVLATVEVNTPQVKGTSTAGITLRNNGGDLIATLGASNGQVAIFEGDIRTKEYLQVGTGSFSGSAALQIDSSNRGFLPPRMTSASRNGIASPATGLVIYNTTNNQLNVYNGTSWGAVGGAVYIDAFTGTTITATNDATQVWRYTGGSAQTLSAITATAAPNGAVIEITGTSNTNTITLNNNDTAGGWIINGSWTGHQYSKLVLRLDTTFNRWVEVSRNGL
jgi:hypothetical protein